MIYTFNKQKNKAEKWERIVCDKFKLQYVGDQQKAYDAMRGKLTIEFKFDFLSFKYGNFFLERWSQDNKEFNEENFGGPWRAHYHKVKEYWQCVPTENKLEIFIYKPIKLIKLVDILVSKLNLKLKSVHNPLYNTLGYAIPRNELEGAAKYKVIKV